VSKTVVLTSAQLPARVRVPKKLFDRLLASARVVAARERERERKPIKCGRCGYKRLQPYKRFRVHYGVRRRRLGYVVGRKCPVCELLHEAKMMRNDGKRFLLRAARFEAEARSLRKRGLQ
jgi:hypothetical protein